MADKKKTAMAISNRKRLFIITIVILLVLLIPIPSWARDGGTVRYRAIVYTVTNYHSFWYEDGYDGFLVGTRIDIFNRTVFENVRFEKR